MLSNDALEKIFKDCDEVSYVKVDGDGYHYQLTIVSDAFIGKSLVARQQWVYKKLGNLITAGTVHALSMKTNTKEEWENTHG